MNWKNIFHKENYNETFNRFHHSLINIQNMLKYQMKQNLALFFFFFIVNIVLSQMFFMSIKKEVLRMDKSIAEVKEEVQLCKPKVWPRNKYPGLTPPCFDYMTDAEKEMWKELDQKCEINDD